MKATPQIVPISELRNDYNHVLSLTEEAPVFLAKNRHVAGMLVSMQAWDRPLQRLDEMHDLVDALEADLAVA